MFFRFALCTASGELSTARLDLSLQTWWDMNLNLARSGCMTIMTLWDKVTQMLRINGFHRKYIGNVLQMDNFRIPVPVITTHWSHLCHSISTIWSHRSLLMCFSMCFPYVCISWPPPDLLERVKNRHRKVTQTQNDPKDSNLVQAHSVAGRHFHVLCMRTFHKAFHLTPVWSHPGAVDGGFSHHFFGKGGKNAIGILKSKRIYAIHQQSICL